MFFEGRYRRERRLFFDEKKLLRYKGYLRLRLREKRNSLGDKRLKCYERLRLVFFGEDKRRGDRFFLISFE